MASYLDDEIGWIHFGFLREKSQELKEFKTYQVMFEQQQGTKIKCLRTNRRGKYGSKEAQDYLMEQSIK